MRLGASVCFVALNGIAYGSEDDMRKNFLKVALAVVAMVGILGFSASNARADGGGGPHFRAGLQPAFQEVDADDLAGLRAGGWRARCAPWLPIPLMLLYEGSIWSVRMVEKKAQAGRWTTYDRPARTRSQHRWAQDGSPSSPSSPRPRFSPAPA